MTLSPLGSSLVSMRTLRVMAATLIAVAVVAACGSGGDDGSADPAGEPDPASGPTTATVVRPDGFERRLARVTKADGEVCELCVWRADDGDQRRRGLMFVTDLGPADGMTFRYGEMRRGWFWMKNTVLPLSIAFFDDEGELVDAFDMEPCIADPCRRYTPARSYSLAIEVPQGDLGRLGIDAGSRLELTDLPCDE